MYRLHYLLLLLLVSSANLLLSLAQGHNDNSSCGIQQFTCDSGECIIGYRECDDLEDCTDGSDEHASCGPSVCVGRWKCDNGRCIPRTSFCDNLDDCGDGSDETTGCIKLYACTDEEYQCPSGKCISRTFLCDGEDDCEGQEDEANCTQTTHLVAGPLCNSTEFDCGNNECIPLELRCDSVLDCPAILMCGDDNRCSVSSLDEANCNGCHGSFQCQNGKCVANSSLCDTFNDCGDNTDELGCTSFTCPDGHFLCNNSHPACVRDHMRCDGNNDCDDGSDEKDCAFSCPDQHFVCNDTHQRCITEERWCDGTIDCRDGSDEADCWNTKCRIGFGYTRCPYNGACIPSDEICDGMNNCINGSDEANCSNMCSSTEFKCHSGEKCIASRKQCDGIFDCFDFSDEDNCSTGVVNCGSQQFDCGPGTSPRCISQAWVCDGLVDCENGLDEVSSNTSHCELQECNKETHFQCLNHSKCIKIQFLCDGFLDCRDGSDEGLFCNSRSCKNATCSHGCSLTHSGPQCFCQRGYHLASDGISCEDFDECSTPGICQQSCVNTLGDYECRCTEGYFANLETDTCMAEGLDPLLLFTNDHDMVTYDLRNLVEVSNLRETHSPTSLAFHYKQSLIFYTDLDRQRIYKYDRSNSTLTSIVTQNLAYPASIDVDWINDKIYWTDYGAGRIESADLNGDNRMTVVSRNNSEFKPLYLTVDPHKRIMFWNTDGSIKAIQVSSMDGSDIRTVVDNIETVSGLTIDRIQERIYWIDYVRKSIETCSYNGMNRFTLFRNNQLIQHPFSLALFENHLYWIDNKLFAVRAMRRQNGSHPITIVGSLRSPRSVTVYQEQMQPDGVNYCAQHNCSHNCLLSSNQSSLNYSCVCPDGLRLNDADSFTCVPYDSHQESVHPACRLNKTFQCTNNICIHNSFVCDGNDDCGDGSDEIDNCTTAICEEGTFFCPGYETLCASDAVMCNHKVECNDGRDEPIKCRKSCEKNQFTCDNLLCTEAKYVCDGSPDCWDGSDEAETLCANQTCKSDEFRCANHGCISKRWVCDGFTDCNDASDERNCDAIPCKPDEFTCGPTGVKYCIPQTLMCDGQDDCGNGNDETKLTCPNSTVCQHDQFNCSNGACIKQRFICDGDDDCGDNSDEQENCLVLPCEGSSIRCNNTGACLPFWRGCDGVDDCGDASDENNCKPGPPLCAHDEFQCHTLHCIPMAAHCDGIVNCADQSDEASCGFSPCIEGSFHCRISNSCTNATFVCDGDFDCADHSDEQRCDIKPKCPDSQFMCYSNNRCIDNYLVCDEKWDCGQGEDEVNCGVNECAIPNENQCSHICEDHVSSYKCSCPNGMRLGNDEKNCEDIDECTEVFGVCDQICTNVKGSYHCGCHDGFTVEPDGHTCKLNEEAILYVATGNLITRKSPDTVSYDKALLASSDNTIRAIAIYQDDLFYGPVHGYIKKHHGVLHSSIAFNTDTENFIAVDTLLDMSVDWVGHKLYWTTDDSAIYCSDTEHPAVTMVADASSGLGVLGEITIHPKSSSMFIVNQYRHSLDAYIERWSLDGRFLQVVVSSKITNPNSIVVDSIIDRVYWSDSVYRYVHTARLDGTDRQSIASGFPLLSNIAIFQNRIYFTVYDQIFHKDRFKTDGVPTLANHNSGFVHDLAFNSTAMQPYSNNPCQNSTCAYACLPSDNTTFTCACPPHSFLLQDNITCTNIMFCPASTKLCNATGVCLPANALCNRYSDCPDRSDELDCDYCDGQFTCSNGHCIPHIYVCNGDNNCGDHSDEASSLCSCDFRCDQNTKCISEEFVCDGQYQCKDKTDEGISSNCSYPPCNTTTHYRCDNGFCIGKDQLCNGVDDCPGTEDENGANCGLNCTLDQFKCHNTSLCLNKSQHCDGTPDCPDHSDEMNCTMDCLESQFHCSDGQCIPLLLKCDGSFNCNDGSDEATDIAGCLDLDDQFTCNSSQCIALHLVCNSHPDCDDGSDESFSCIPSSNNSCAVENGGCDQLCSMTDNKVHCFCFEGYRLSSDGRSCTDIDECEVDGYCSQLCHNEVGSYHCACFDGFILSGNGTCNALDQEPVLIGASGTEIVKFKMSSNSVYSVYTSDQLVSSIDYDVEQRRLMWLEDGHDAIYSYSIQHNATAKSVLVTGLTSINTFTYDWISRSIIWSCKTDGKVYITSLDRAQYTLLQLPDSMVPSSIAVDPFRQYLYFTTVGNGTVIKSSLRSQDHNSYSVLVPGLLQPSQIVIDFYSGLLFFADVEVHAIMSVRYDGSGLRVVLDQQHVHMPESLAVFEDKVFYSETGVQTVYWANKFGHSGPQMLQTLSSSALTIFHPLLQPLQDPYENTLFQPCKDDPCNVGLCLPVNDTSFRCICPEGYIINSTGVCVKDVCSSNPCVAGSCVPNGTDGYYCKCPEGYESVGSYCNAMQSENTGHSRSDSVVGTTMIVVVVLVLILTTTIGVIVIGRRYYRHTIRVREERIEDAQDDCKKSMSETDSNSYRISPDSTTHQLINTQL